MRIVALITARISSTRLPGKVLMDIEGKPMLERIVERVRKSKYIESVVVATTTEDTQIKKWAIRKEFTWFAGAKEDILDRIYHAARKNNADIVLRVWGDCALIDPEIIDDTIKYYFDNDMMYVINTGFPTGLNVAVISYGALRKANKRIKDPEQRLWIHKHFIDNPKEYRVGEYRHSPDLSKIHWAIDTAEDMEWARYVYRMLGEDFRWKDVLRLWQSKR